MKNYRVEIDQDALLDILGVTEWYNNEVPYLGLRFQKQVKQQISSLRTKAKSYGTKYHDVRCMSIKNFPYLVHYVIEDKTTTVKVFAVIHTSRNPLIWEEKRKK